VKSPFCGGAASEDESPGGARIGRYDQSTLVRVESREDRSGCSTQHAVRCWTRRHRWHEGEVEVVERLARRQLRLGPVTLEAPALAVCDLLAGQRGEQARRRPALPVRTVGEAAPQRAHGWQPELLQQQVELRRIDDETVAHYSFPACRAGEPKSS